MTIYQDPTAVYTDADGETADTNPTGVVELTGATDPLGVETPPTKEDSKQDDKDDANVTERH